MTSTPSRGAVDAEAEGTFGPHALLEALQSGELTCVEREDLAPEPPASLAVKPAPTEEMSRSPEPSLAAPGFRLPDAYLAEAKKLRASFEAAEVDAAPGERLIEELIAGETAIARSLADSEAALASILQHCLTNPKLAVEVTKTLREVSGLSTAIRRRIEHSLRAVADLRAQRKFLQGRSRNGV